MKLADPATEGCGLDTTVQAFLELKNSPDPSSDSSQLSDSQLNVSVKWLCGLRIGSFPALSAWKCANKACCDSAESIEVSLAMGLLN